MKCKHYPIYCIGATLIILSILFLWLLLLQRNTTVPHSIRLADCTNSTLEFHLEVPRGNSYYLVLATPKVGMTLKPPYFFSGHVSITEVGVPTNMTDFQIDSTSVQQCNWLEENGIPYSFALTGAWNTNCTSLGQLIRAQRNYNVIIVFSQPPPPSTSIWLHWLQAYKDRDK